MLNFLLWESLKTFYRICHFLISKKTKTNKQKTTIYLSILIIFSKVWFVYLQIANSMTEIENKKKNTPHIYNLNMDPQLTGHIFYFFESTPILVGKAEDEANKNIQLMGPR